MDAADRPPKTPNLNAHVERFFESLTEERLNRRVFSVEKWFENVVTEYVARCHAERSHQGIDNRLIDQPDEPSPSA